MFNDEKPDPKPTYVLGQDIYDFSVADIDDMVAQLQAEIERLAAERKKKAGSIDAAAALFRS